MVRKADGRVLQAITKGCSIFLFLFFRDLFSLPPEMKCFSLNKESFHEFKRKIKYGNYFRFD